MGKTLKNALKMGIAFFIIGMTLATIGPTVAEVIGFSGEALAHIAQANAMPLWTGTFFGMFGAMSQVVPPLVDRLFGDTPTTHNQLAEPAQKLPSKTIENSQNLDVLQPAKEQDFVSKINAERAQQSSITVGH
jgi:hypothetical protein